MHALIDFDGDGHVASRTIAAAPQRVWEVIEDPHHMPRWWPGVQRMEGVEDDRFTQVFTTKKGRPVRIDFHVLELRARRIGEQACAQRSWEQEIAGTPFERVLRESVTEVVLEPDGDGHAGDDRAAPEAARLLADRRVPAAPGDARRSSTRRSTGSSGSAA